MTTRKPKVKSKLCYTPDADLIKFLEERLDLLKKQRMGKRSNLKDSILKRNNNSKKVRYLNDYVFPSMANVLAFFEYMKNNPELQKDFEEDIQELLMGWSKNDKWGFPAFFRLILGVFSWEYDQDPFNFRLNLLYLMQKMIVMAITEFTKKDFDKGSPIAGITATIVKPDMERAWAWTELYARLNRQTQKKWEDYGRPLLF